LCDGRVGLPQYETECVRRADVRALRAKTVLVPSPGIARDAARLEARLRDGTIVEEQVAHGPREPGAAPDRWGAVRESPALIEPQLGGVPVGRLVDAVLAIEDAASLDVVIASAVPEASANV